MSSQSKRALYRQQQRCARPLETYANLIGKSDAAQGLKQNLEENKGSEAQLTMIAEEQVNQQAAGSAGRSAARVSDPALRRNNRKAADPIRIGSLLS